VPVGEAKHGAVKYRWGDLRPNSGARCIPSEHQATFGSGRQTEVFVQVRKSALLLSLMLLWLGERIRFDRSENIH
jgi:hypothetical protein